MWAAEEALTRRLQRSPTATELAEELGVPIDEVIETLSMDGCFAPSSLDAPAISQETGSLAERLGSTDEEFERCEARLLLADAVRRLDQRDRTIVRMRFVEGRTQQEIGDEIGVTQMQVSRLLTRILAQLRQTIEQTAA